MFGITWAGTHTLWYVSVFILSSVILIYRYIQWHRVVHFLTTHTHARTVLLNFSLVRRILGTALFFIGMLFLILALFQPQWNKKEDVVHQQGRDLFIALDISRSMLAADCVPNRLLCAKEKIKQLVQNLACERVGLIIFSGSTFVQCPLTSDYGAFLMFLNQIDAETISSGATRLDEAIKTALRSFQALKECQHKLLVIVTDGEDFSPDLTGVQQQAKDLCLHIFTWGIGTRAGAPVPCVDELGKLKGHQKDANGAVVISCLHEDTLAKIAHESGGYYVPMSHDDTDIKKIVSVVAKYEKNAFEDRTISRYEEQYPWFIAVSLICFCLEWFL